MQVVINARKPRKQAISGHFRYGRTYSRRIKDDVKIDPCMGSGHILCVLFDTLVRIYEDYGYTAREAASSIVENNLWGLDIDERAAQLSYFAVMMKARQYDRRFFSRGIQPHVYAIEESNGLRYDGDYGDFLLDKSQQETLNYMFDAFKDAKEYGSILDVESRDYDGFLQAWSLTAEQALNDLRMLGWYMIAGEKVASLAHQAKALSQNYDIVVTNPPYMGNRGIGQKLNTYVQREFPNSKMDLFAVFIERCKKMVKRNGFQGMITQHAWMFLSSFEKMRADILKTNIINMAHLGARAFDEIGGEVVQTTSFVLRRNYVDGYRSVFCRLIDYANEAGKETGFLSGDNQYAVNQEHFSNIPSSPIAYWAGKSVFDVYQSSPILESLADVRHGLSTGKNEIFVRLWTEIDVSKFDKTVTTRDELVQTNAKYFPYNKGGEYRKWYGNADYVVWYNSEGQAKMKEMSGHRHDGRDRYFQEGITWSFISTNNFGVRYTPTGFVFDVAGSSMFADHNILIYLVGLLCSKLGQYFMSLQNPTLNFQVGNLRNVPVIVNRDAEVRDFVCRNIEISQEDWDSFETSWDFQSHPIAPMSYERQEHLSAGMNSEERRKAVTLLSVRYRLWEQECEYRFSELKKNEEELNRIFIDIYGLQDELTPEVDDKDVTVRKADLQREIRSLISYAVGCMFGRYSLDVPGLAYAGGEWDASKYTIFQPDKDAIIPICDDEYFEDDIVGRFVKFIEVVYGKETLEENLQFIAQALGGKGTSREVIRNYFINDFYADHVKVYQKRPIYWLFDSGKKNGFKCLVYMHRYQSDTIARIRTDYVHEQQSRYRTAIADLEQRINGASTSERVKLNKQLTTMQAQATEIREYEEKIHHLADQMIRIDLDDGVKHNYEIFKDVLAKIK